MSVIKIFAAAGLALAAAVATPPAQAGTAETLQSECTSQLKLSESACACIGQKAEAELNAKQQEMVIAQVQKNIEQITKLRAELSLDDVTPARQFMLEAPQVCANK